MSQPIRRDRLKSALEATGNAWGLQREGAWVEEGIARLEQELDEFAQAYQQRFGDRPDPFALLETDRYKGAAFFSPDTLRASVEMKIMIWRILLGSEILRIDFRYELRGATTLEVTLCGLTGEKETYRSQVPFDFKVLRHIGATGINGNLILQGYYALR
jgi:hypothetical protein